MKISVFINILVYIINTTLSHIKIYACFQNKKNYYTMHQRNKCLCLKPRNYQYSVRRIYIVGLYDEKVLLKNLHSGFCFRETKNYRS